MASFRLVVHHQSPSSMPRGERRMALPKAHLTTRSIAGAPLRAKRHILWNDTMGGFGAPVSLTERRSSIIKDHTGPSGLQTDNRKKVLGHSPAMSVRAARRRARALLRDALLEPRGGDAGGTMKNFPSSDAAFHPSSATLLTQALMLRDEERQVAASEAAIESRVFRRRPRKAQAG